jgi:palmitoyltransferase
MNGDLALCKQLVEQEGSDVNTADAEGNTALHWAVYRRHNEVARYLIQKGCLLEPGNKTEGQTALHWAAIAGNVQAMLLLLNSGASTAKKDNRGYNALQHAVQYNEILAVHLMLSRGVPLDGVDNEGHTALHWAAYQGHEGLVRYLINRGAQIDVQDNGGCTPLHWAAVKGHSAVVGVLLEHHADVKAKDRDGATPERLAFQKKHYNLANRLRDATRNSFVDNSSEKNKYMWFAVTMLGIPYSFLLVVNLPLWISLVLVIASGYGLKMGCGRKWPSKESSNPAFVGVFITTYIVSTLLYFTRIIYVTGASVGGTVFFILLNFFYAGSYLKVLFSDPGCIKATTELNQVIEAIDDDMPHPQICPTCLIQKPLRSKHCRACGKCVSKMDHHCHWINNCVGEKNHVLFVVVLTCIILLHFMFSWYCSVYLQAVPGAEGLSFTSSIAYYFEVEPLVLSLMLFIW